MKKKRVSIDKDTFDRVKLLIRAGVKGTDLRRLSGGVSGATCSYIRNSDTLEEYKKKSTESARKFYVKSRVKKKATTPVAKKIGEPIIRSTSEQLLTDIRDIMLANQQILISIKNRIVEEDRTNPITNFFRGK